MNADQRDRGSMWWALPASIAAHIIAFVVLVAIIRSEPHVSIQTGDAATHALSVFLVEAFVPPDPPPPEPQSPQESTPAPLTAPTRGEGILSAEPEHILVSIAARSLAPAASLELVEPVTASAPSKPPAPPTPPSNSSSPAAAGPVPRPGNPAPTYPEECLRRRQEGTVTLRFVVSPEGSVAQVRVESTSGHTALDQAALGAAAKWRFEPAVTNGSPSESEAVIPVRFTLTSAKPQRSR